MFSLVTKGAVLAASVLCGAAYTDEALADQVTALPGAEKLDINFNQFSGYLTVDGTKQMHYWFVESMNNPADAPVAFWTNGGPGCSGLLGFLTEQGPFRPNKDMSLSFNEYAWNQVSNMVFIESPVGVGYSYSTAEDTTDDYQMDDAETAADNYALIQEIVDQNTAGQNPKLNFKGFAVGNPFTEPYSGTPAMIDTYWGHQLISGPVYKEFTEECRDAKVPNVTTCEMLFYKIYFGVGNINPYALGRGQRDALLRNILGGAETETSRQIYEAILQSDNYEPCEDDYATSYMNLPEVKAAIHVNDKITWAECSRSIRYKQSDGRNSMVPIYSYLIDGGYDLDILVFSGDDDGVCATIGVQNWIWGLGYEVTGRMYQAYEVAGQMAGYATKWAGAKLGFVTVHGAGHEVPTYKPEVALELWKKYLNGEWTN
ncbi:SCPL28 [Symbiodinium microadriaticum]|nr:SCPL28 [Symbiodinium microadriaticum]